MAAAGTLPSPPSSPPLPSLKAPKSAGSPDGGRKLSVRSRCSRRTRLQKFPKVPTTTSRGSTRRRILHQRRVDPREIARGRGRHKRGRRRHRRYFAHKCSSIGCSHRETAGGPAEGRAGQVGPRDQDGPRQHAQRSVRGHQGLDAVHQLQ